MNNRLHKLTDKEGSLNYYSRHRGKPHPSRHSRHSPLIPPHTPAPSLLTSRTRPLTASRMTESPRSPEILIMEEQEQSRQNGQILIVEDQEQVESVYQHEEEEPIEFYKSETREEQQSQEREKVEKWEKEDCYEQKQAQLEEYRAISPERTKQERSESSPSPSKESPIYILEEDQNLIWIQKEEGHSGSKSNSIKIQTDSDSSQENQKQSQEKDQFFNNLPNIMELSSIEQQDVEESFHSMTTSRIPVSPQTAPFIRLHPVQQNLRHETKPDEEQKEKDRESLTWWPGGSSPRRSVAIAIQDEQSESESHQQSSQKHHAYLLAPANCLLDSDQLSEVFSLEESKPLSQSTLKTLDLIDSISPRKINSVVGMQHLIEQQAQKYHRIIKDQQGTIAIYRTLLEIRLKVPQLIVKKQQQRLDVDGQITANQHILRSLAAFKDKKAQMRIR